MKPKLIATNEKKTIKMKCKSFGITSWYHNDKLMDTKGLVKKERRSNYHILKIKNVGMNDSGNYVCIGWTKDRTPFQSDTVVYVSPVRKVIQLLGLTLDKLR